MGALSRPDWSGRLGGVVGLCRLLCPCGQCFLSHPRLKPPVAFC